MQTDVGRPAYRRRRTSVLAERAECVVSRVYLRDRADETDGAARDPWGVMNVLVAYASKHGSTAEIAEAIAAALRQSGLSVDCTVAGEVKTLEPYDAVVLGSAVYIKRWRGDAKHFLRKHHDGLSQRPFWVFSSGPVGEPKGEVDLAWLEPPRIVDQVERIGARGHVVFGGRMPTNPRGPAQRAMVANCPPEYRDRRDWDEIRAWATSVASELRARVPST
jgi:menaquinone-dependent protoporphyrinogen oxidase